MTSVFLHFLNLSVTAGWMVLAVLLLRLCLKKAPRWITCVLWGLVALRLVVPFTIESPVSLIPTAEVVVSTEDTDTSAPMVNSGMTAIDKPLNDWLQTPVKPQAKPPVQSPLPPVTDTPITPNPDLPTEDTTPTPQPPVEETPTTPEQPSASTEVKSVSRMERILNIAAPVWLVGIGLMLIYELFSVLRVRNRVLDAVLLRDNVWQSDRVDSPFILGVFRPRIYIPYGLEEPVLAQVLSHEQAHLHRRDHWIKPFAFTLLAVYWYNPLLWVGYILLCRDIEVACDERVVRGLDEDNRRRYATALLQCGVERRSIAACPLAFGEVSIKQRIKSVLNYRKPLLWVIIVSLVVCSVAAVCLLTVPKSKDNGKKEEPLVVLSSEEIKPDQERLFYSTDIDGALIPAGFDWLWEHAENSDAKTPDIEYWEETNIPLAVSKSKADLDELMDVCSDPMGLDMRYWFELEKYDDAFFEDKVLVWLHVPGYGLGYYDYTVTLEETNKGLRYAVSLVYESTSIFGVQRDNCEYLLLFETDRSVIEEAKSLTTRHEKAPVELPTEEGLTMVSVGSADVDGDGEAEDIRLYHSALEWGTGWDSGYEIAYLVVCKKDGTPILRERTLVNTYSQCYLVPQEDGSSLLLLLEAGDVEYAYSEEHFGVLSLKDGERTVLDDKYESMHPTGWLGIDFGSLTPYVLTLSDWMENAQLLYECDNGTIYHGDTLGDTARYRPMCWLDEYRDSADDTLQDILENILASLGGETVSCGELDFDSDGDNETLSVVRYVDEDGIYQHSGLVVRQADGSILTAAHIHYDYVEETRGLGSYVYRVKTADGVALKMVRQWSVTEDFNVYDVTTDGVVYNNGMTMGEWLEYRDAHDGKLLFYFQGTEMHFSDAVDFSLYKDVSAANLTDQQARELAALLVDRQIEIHFLAQLDWDKVDTTVKCPFDENYVLCTDLRFSCVQDIRNFVLQGLTAEAAQVWFDRHLDGPYNPPDSVNRYIDYDGKLWTDTYSEGAGWSRTFLTDTARIVSRTADTVTIEMDTLYFGVEDIWRYTPTLVKTEAGWRLASPDFWDGYEDTQGNYLTVDPANDTVENYNDSITAYNQFLRGLRAAHEYGELDKMFYVSDLYTDMSETKKGVQRYTLADVTGDGVPELITSGETWNIFTYQSGRLLRLYETVAGLFPKLLSNGCLWEERLGGGNTYRYTKFFEIGSTRTAELGDPGYDTDEDKYYVDDVWMNKADFDAKTATYFANAKSPALLIWYDYTTKQPTSQAMVQYLSLLQSKYSDNSGAYYTLYDVNGDGEDELLIKEDGDNQLLVYTKGNNEARLLVEQEFASGTSRFLSTGDPDYPGIIYFCVGGGKNQYYYLSKGFALQPLWTDNYGFYEEGEAGRITELSDDKRLIELSREAYRNNRDIAFSLFGGSVSTIALDRQYQQAVYAYSSDSKNHRDVGVLQPETQDIILIDGKYYQTCVASNVDVRNVWLSQNEADIGTAYWGWVAIGTEDDYSLSNIGKMDYVHHVPVALQPVVGNRQTFIYQGKSILLSDLLSQYDDEIGRYAVVDMDGDNGLELAVEFNSLQFILILKKEADAYYGYLFSFRNMYQINTDGSFHWNTSAGNFGCSRIQLSGGTSEETELWHVERDGNDVSAYYVEGKKVTETQFESLTAETKNEVLWYEWP